MGHIKKIIVSTGIYWIEIPEAELFILCGCPADCVKHLMKRGLIIEVEKNNVRFETGPNAILLSEILIQNEQFSNLSEFPVLQMLYHQGLLVPNHPNNTGNKPLLIGTKEQVAAQKKYIYRGNYGLTSINELKQAGLSDAEAKVQMNMKLKFAFGKIQKTNQLLDSHIVGVRFKEIRNGVSVRHTGVNRFEFKYKGETVSVDLNLAPCEVYEPPYDLGFHQPKREYFSIIHSGEGNGWDLHRPSMSSILVYQGKIYLIDAGPNIDNILVALGISFDEVEGIFHTHVHDDHFAGLPTLLSTERRLKYYSTRLVRASVTKKLCSLMSISEERFSHYFEIHDLKMDHWNNLNGLEVKPLFAPHPVENSMFLFRTFGLNDYVSYAHWADLASFDVLEGMLTDDPNVPGVSRAFIEQIRKDYLIPATLKKIDIGGGMIHGNAKDFLDDQSEKIILAHTSSIPKPSEKIVGELANFGVADVLVSANRDYLREMIKHYYYDYFPNVDPAEIEGQMNCPIVSINAGSIILKSGKHPEFIYFVVSGWVEILRPNHDTFYRLGRGTFLGAEPVLNNTHQPVTIIAGSYVQLQKIPRRRCLHFFQSNGLVDHLRILLQTLNKLYQSWLFSSFSSSKTLVQIIRHSTLHNYEAGQIILRENEMGKDLFVLNHGKVELSRDGMLMEVLEGGDVFGEEHVVSDIPSNFTAKAIQNVEVTRIDESTILNIPIADLRLRSLFEKRCRAVALSLKDDCPCKD